MTERMRRRFRLSRGGVKETHGFALAVILAVVLLSISIVPPAPRAAAVENANLVQEGDLDASTWIPGAEDQVELGAANDTAAYVEMELTQGDVAATPQAPLYSISGTVKSSKGIALAGVSIAYDGKAAGSVKTDTNGRYSIRNLAAGFYTLTPGKASYSFIPPGKAVTLTDRNVSGQNFTGKVTPRAAAPVFHPVGGVFNAPVDIVCTTATVGGVIHYTTDGSDPTEQSPVYTAPFQLSTTATLKARTYRKKMLPSAIVSASFVVYIPESTDKTTFKVHWTDQTTVVDKEHLNLLLHSDALQQTYTFDRPGVSAAGLDLSVDRILVVYGTAFGRIVSSTPRGRDLVVTLEPAALGDAIRDGLIDWDFAVPFTADRIQIVDPGSASGAPLRDARVTGPGTLRPDRAGTGLPIQISFKNGPFEYEIKINLVGESADIEITVKKDLASKIVSTYSIKSHLEAFRSKNRLRIVNGQLVTYNHNINKLKGETALQLVVAGSGSDLGYVFPFTIMKVPFLIGPIPASLQIAVRFVVNAVVPIDGSARVDTKISYDSDLGFNYDGTNVSLKAQLGTHQIDSSEKQPYAASSSQMAATFGVGFPEIRLAIGAGIEAAAWLRPGFVIGASFTAYNTPIPVCLVANAEFLGATGYDTSVFGFESDLTKGSWTLFDYKKELRRSGQCPP